MSKLKFLNKKSRILSIADSDLDGAGSQIVLGNAFDNIEFRKATYSTIDSVLEQLDYSKYDFVILTDITPSKKSLLDLSDKIIVIDHHESVADIDNQNAMRFIVPGYCSTYLAKYFCEKQLKINLNYLNNLVTLINDYDLWNLKYDKSRFLNCLFYKYFSERFQKRFFDGNTRFTPEEMSYLRKERKKFLEIYNDLEVYDLDSINGCLVQATQFHNDICHKLIDSEGYSIVFFRNPQTKKVSVRAAQNTLHVGNMLKALDMGGGHKEAGGFYEPSVESLQKKLVQVENYIYKNFQALRKKK